MSAWLWPTTADVGMRVFANSLASLLGEAATGVQAYLISETSARTINAHVRRTGEWSCLLYTSPSPRDTG